MSGDLVLAIDAGGTAVKVMLADGSGQALAVRMAAVKTDHHPDGRVERAAAPFWQATAGAIRALLAEDPQRAGRIAAIGCTGFGNGVFLVDAAGQATRPGIVSVDHRAQGLVDRLRAGGQVAALQAISGHRLWGGQTLMQIVNLALTEPGVMERSRWALPCKDFIRFCLTGAAFSDPTDASGGGLMELQAGTYGAGLFRALGQPGLVAKLAPLVANSAIGGRVSAAAAAETGLIEGTPVAGSMMDVAACALGAGSADADSMVMIAGTWAINCLETPLAAPTPEAPILNMLHRDGACRLVAEGSPSSAATLGWYLERGLGQRLGLAEANAMVAASAVQGRRCQFLPHLHGPAPRHGAFLGLGAGDDTASLLRAIFEGVAFQHRRHAEQILPFAEGRWPGAIRLAGGAARSAPWAQIFADICQRPVEVAEAEEVGALGAAICAAVAGGLHPDLTAATAAMTRVARRHDPNPDHKDFYDHRFAEFQRLDLGLQALSV